MDGLRRELGTHTGRESGEAVPALRSHRHKSAVSRRASPPHLSEHGVLRRMGNDSEGEGARKAACIRTVVRAALVCGVLAMSVTCHPFVGWGAARSEAEKEPAVELAKGMIGADQWRASAMAPELVQEQEEGNVCLSISFLEVWTKQERAEGNEVAQCGELGTHEIMFESYTKHRGQKRPHSAVAFLLVESASRIVLKLKGTPPETIRLRHLPSQPATGGRRLAYFARGYARPFCLQHLTAYNATGQRIAHLAGQRCL